MLQYDRYSEKRILRASGLVVKFNVAIVEPRVRFSAGAFIFCFGIRGVVMVPGRSGGRYGEVLAACRERLLSVVFILLQHAVLSRSSRL